jgi:hypothetical protein
MGKKEIEKRLSKVKRDYERVLEQKRLEWLQRVCNEARETYNFSGLGELVVWMVDNADKVQLKSGDNEP